MLDAITGEVVRKEPSSIVLRSGGIGFHLSVPHRVLRDLPESGEVTLFCHLAVREDSMKLYGFESVFEREVFGKLNSVAGVGAATALSILSDSPPTRIIEAIMSDNDVFFQKVKGIGAKTAKRIVLELKGKVEELALAAAVDGSGVTQAAHNIAGDLLAALTALGFARHKAKEAALKVVADSPGEENLEKLIRSALMFMGG
jgi:Holliday junction DNA helicase RuvA